MLNVRAFSSTRSLPGATARQCLMLSVLACWLIALSGCAQIAVRHQSPEALAEAAAEAELVSDLTVPYGIHPHVVHSTGLVVGLPGTGSDPALGPGRQTMVEEIQRHGVPQADAFLSSPNTALVNVRAMIPPGAQKGDRIDVEVLVPRESQTTSLADGRLLETRLREFVRLGGRYREGHVMALAKGSLLVDPAPEQERNPESQLRARILGGAVAVKPRPLGLTLRPSARSIRNSRRIGTAINKRFYTKQHGRTVGVANPKSDEYIDLIVHPRYKDNIQRYLEVLRSVAVGEAETQRRSRVALLSRQLLDSITTRAAALRLEALGEHGREALHTGLNSSNSEVRFHAAEALAYLDDPEAAAVLAEAVRDSAAFRAGALAALAVMDSPEAYDALVNLLDSRSVEARYGAFHALWKLNPGHPLVRGEDLNGTLTLHQVRSEGPALIHVTRSRRPEVVVFGSEITFLTPMVVDAGRHIMINGDASGQVRLTRFSTDDSERTVHVSNRLEDVIRAIVDLGGSYADVVDALSQARASRSLDCRLAVDALPSRGRPNRRTEGQMAESDTRSPQAADDAGASGLGRLRPASWPAAEPGEP
ncbi:MAG: hypothetical protein DWQ42_03415 [Planctomycetota bacterium]|nr:MAG: hypothetical protein DWQ42_03415 [Planctomycetota bacterium]REK47872.1 MAG: hypothetical protein DWQ46_02945 [Planctomycetota bacterium]